MKKLLFFLVLIPIIFACDYSTSRIKENSTLLKFPAVVSGDESSTTSVYQLEWLTGQREGSHDGGILEQTWFPPRSGTITALVRSTKESDTRFVEIIHISEINSSLELNLQIFNNLLEPENISATFSKYNENSDDNFSVINYTTTLSEVPEKYDLVLIIIIQKKNH